MWCQSSWAWYNAFVAVKLTPSAMISRRHWSWRLALRRQ
jgi:hypothetical protein